jgi:hypothetical protein
VVLSGGNYKISLLRSDKLYIGVRFTGGEMSLVRGQNLSKIVTKVLKINHIMAGSLKN